MTNAALPAVLLQACALWSLYNPELARYCPNAPMATNGTTVASVEDWFLWTRGDDRPRSSTDRQLKPQGPIPEFKSFIATFSLAREAPSDRLTGNPISLRLRATEAEVLTRSLQKEAGRGFELNPDAIQRHLLELPENRLRRGSLVRLRNLYLRFPVGPEVERDGTRRAMEKLRQQALEGADFGSLARRFSHSSSRYREGRLGWIGSDSLRPEISASAANLRAGEISEVLETKDGLTVLLCEGTRPAWIADPLSQLKIAEADLRNQLVEDWWSQYRDRVARGVDFDPPLCDADRRSREEGPLATMNGEVLTTHHFETLHGRSACTTPKSHLETTIVNDFVQLVASREAVTKGLHESLGVRAEVTKKSWLLLAEVRLEELLSTTAWQPRAFEIEQAIRRSALQLREPERVEIELLLLPLGSQPALQAGWITTVLEDGSDGSSIDLLRDLAKKLAVLAPTYHEFQWLGMDQIASWGRPFWEAIRSLEPGGATGLVETSSGFAVARLRARRPGGLVEKHQAAKTVRQRLTTRARNLAIRALVDGTLDGWKPATPNGGGA